MIEIRENEFVGHLWSFVLDGDQENRIVFSGLNNVAWTAKDDEDVALPVDY